MHWHYLLAAAIIFIIIACILVYYKHKRWTINLRNSLSGLAVVDTSVYGVSKRGGICVYNTRTRECIRSQRFGGKLRGCKIINGKLYTLAIDDDETELIAIDPDSLDIIESRKLPFSETVAFVDRRNSVGSEGTERDDEWIVCDDGAVYMFDEGWNLVGQWELPERINPAKVLDGRWINDHLYILTRGKLYVLSLEDDADTASIRRTINTGYTHDSFHLTNGVLWYSSGEVLYRTPLSGG